MTAGVAYADSKLTVEDGDDELQFDAWGPVYGAGLEYAVTPRFSVRAEWLRYGTGRVFTSTGQADNGNDSIIDDLDDGDEADHLSWDGIDTVRVGLNYRFGAGSSAPLAYAAPANFSGASFAAYGGWSFADVGGQYDAGGGDPTTGFASFDMDGIAGGLGIGYTFQNGGLVYGIDADANLVDIGDSFTDGEDDTQSLDINSYYTVRGRLGVAAGNFLVYGTAGVAFSQLDLTVENGDDSLGVATTGLAYGGGVEYAVNDRFSIRGELLRLDFNKGLPAIDDGVLDDLDDGDEEDNLNFGGINVVRAGIVIRF